MSKGGQPMFGLGEMYCIAVFFAVIGIMIGGFVKEERKREGN